jgi:hypothetical protein
MATKNSCMDTYFDSRGSPRLKEEHESMFFNFFNSNQNQMKKTINYFFAGFSLIILLSLGMGGCSKSNSTLPPISGYATANDVAKDNLLAHWTFDNTSNEAISSTAPTTHSGDTYTTGQVGQALKLTAGHVVYPTIPALSGANVFPSVTVSLWVNIANNGTTATNIFGITQSTTAQTDWNTGPVNLYMETASYKTGQDTLRLHSNFSTWISGTRYGGDNLNYDFGSGKSGAGTHYQWVLKASEWFHYVMVWDASTSNIDIYANGVLVSNDVYRNRTYTPSGSSTAVGLGPIINVPPTQVIFGGWATAANGFANSPDQGWQGLMTGSVDETRVYSKALTAAEIGTLYAFGVAGRD